MRLLTIYIIAKQSIVGAMTWAYYIENDTKLVDFLMTQEQTYLIFCFREKE